MVHNGQVPRLLALRVTKFAEHAYSKQREAGRVHLMAVAWCCVSSHDYRINCVDLHAGNADEQGRSSLCTR